MLISIFKYYSFLHIYFYVKRYMFQGAPVEINGKKILEEQCPKLK